MLPKVLNHLININPFMLNGFPSLSIRRVNFPILGLLGGTYHW